jgi:hypothetical protein
MSGTPASPGTTTTPSDSGTMGSDSERAARADRG